MCAPYMHRRKMHNAQQNDTLQQRWHQYHRGSNPGIGLISRYLTSRGYNAQFNCGVVVVGSGAAADILACSESGGTDRDVHGGGSGAAIVATVAINDGNCNKNMHRYLVTSARLGNHGMHGASIRIALCRICLNRGRHRTRHAEESDGGGASRTALAKHNTTTSTVR